MAIVVAAAGIGGVVAVVLTYHEVTKIDRTEPLVVLDEYLDAVLVRKDRVGAELYECSGSSNLTALANLRGQLNERERSFGVEVLVTWGAMSQAGQGSSISATTELTVIALEDGSEQSRSSQAWRFTLVNQDGWRVCAAERTTAASPSPSAG
ncbi:hypothetical protein [Catellatospora paridis]|uniref:hypothetical protein n=1 Tax=Catellatospora paridis TaxID=1617086 RepID=UPI0012D41779|nr:hypothetical protein [Catellatospora paridis]